jgi:beta-xylosidase
VGEGRTVFLVRYGVRQRDGGCDWLRAEAQGCVSFFLLCCYRWHCWCRCRPRSAEPTWTDIISPHCAQAAGFRSDHNVSIWQSPDLTSWSLARRAAIPFDSRPIGIYFRPKVIFNHVTQTYVMWVNYMEYPTPYAQGYYLSATSKTPTGPWIIANRNITMTQKQPAILCDFDLMRDDDGIAYIIYTVWRPQGMPKQATHMSVERLSSDFTASTLNASAVFTGPAASGDEAPVIFRRKGIVYAMFGHGCCFCKGGSGVNVFTADHPLGP